MSADLELVLLRRRRGAPLRLKGRRLLETSCPSRAGLTMQARLYRYGQGAYAAALLETPSELPEETEGDTSRTRPETASGPSDGVGGKPFADALSARDLDGLATGLETLVRDLREEAAAIATQAAESEDEDGEGEDRTRSVDELLDRLTERAFAAIRGEAVADCVGELLYRATLMEARAAIS